MKKSSFLSELLQRFNQETPDFFKTVTKIGGVLLALGAIPTSAELTDLHLQLPGMLTTISHYLVVAGGVMIAVAQTACKSLTTDES